MSKPVLDPSFWRDRLQAKELRHSVFVCPAPMWQAICDRHRAILSVFAGPLRDANILDVGCGYGRLLDLLPASWRGNYLGIDLSPNMVDKAKELHPDKAFVCANTQVFSPKRDVAILISVRKMIQDNCDAAVWPSIQSDVEASSKHQLYLEYGEGADEWASTP